MNQGELTQLLITNPETNLSYTCMVSVEDANKARYDMEFAQKLLQQVINENETQPRNKRNNIDTELIEDRAEVNENENPGFRWASEQVLLLIRLVESNHSLFDTGLKKNVWVKIATQLTNMTGKIFTADQIDNKWKGLKKTYKKIKDHNNKSGNERKTWEFYNAMDALLAKKPEIVPVAVCSTFSNVVTVNKDPDVIESGEETSSSTSGFVSNVMRKRKRAENMAQKRHDEKMARYDKFLNLFQKSVEHQIGHKIDG